MAAGAQAAPHRSEAPPRKENIESAQSVEVTRFAEWRFEPKNAWENAVALLSRATDRLNGGLIAR
jgi:hypothetical protein